jgi:hypothetical protein
LESIISGWAAYCARGSAGGPDVALDVWVHERPKLGDAGCHVTPLPPPVERTDFSMSYVIPLKSKAFEAAFGVLFDCDELSLALKILEIWDWQRAIRVNSVTWQHTLFYLVAVTAVKETISQ